MSMLEAIKGLNKQFAYTPEISGTGKLKKFQSFTVAGMGGSQLAAIILNAWKPNLSLINYRNYGLPDMKLGEAKKNLIIASSYSGNTEETLSAFETARKKKLPVIAITVGGKLLNLAKKYKTHYIQLPDTGIEPRSALGLSLKALVKITHGTRELNELTSLVSKLMPEKYETQGKNLAEKIKNFIPVIYSSLENNAIAYYWKITLNETAKTPAFMNVFPELNHNEMISFENHLKTENLTRKFKILLIKDAEDDTRIQKRMSVLQKIYSEINLPVDSITLEGDSRIHKLIASTALAEWTAYNLSRNYETSPDEVLMIEKFKELMQ